MRRSELAPNPEVLKPDGEREKMDPKLPDLVPYKAPAGSAIVMDYTTGQVMAMASYPTFDNRWFKAGLSSEKFKQIFPDTEDPDLSILVNRAIQGRYNMGSTFKPFIAYSALNTGLITAGELFNDEGEYRMHTVDQGRCDAGLVRCVYKNATCSGTQRPCRYGPVNVDDALAISSDAFFYRIGEDIMAENNFGPVLQEQVKKFGFGADTGIDLPFEFDGTVPDKALKKRYAELGVISEDEGRGYFVGDNVQLAIGQGLLSATPLQLANAYATIANSGFVLRPQIVKAIWNPGVPDGEPGAVDLAARHRQGVVRQAGADPPGRRCRARFGCRSCGPPACGHPGRDAGSSRTATTSPPARTCSTTTRTRRSRSPARPAPPRAPATSRGTTRRSFTGVQHRRDQPIRRDRLPREVGLRIAGSGARRQVHVPRAVGNAHRWSRSCSRDPLDLNSREPRRR